MTKPLVSCLMPTRNRPQFLSLAVEMFLKQSYGNAELIIIDDGECRIPSGVQWNPDIVRYHQLEGTIGAKLNFAAWLARGEILMRWDDDDFYHPDRIAFQLDHMRRSGKAMIGMASLVFHREGADCGWEYMTDSYDPLGTTQCFRRDWLLANPLIDASLGEDPNIAWRARQQGELSVVSGFDHLIVARDHDSNTGNRVGDEVRASKYCLNWRKLDLSGRWFEETVKPMMREAVAA